MMKKLFIILCLMAFAFVGCEKETFTTPQPRVAVPEPIMITNDDWTKFVEPEWIFDNDTLTYCLICEKVVEQPVREVNGSTKRETYVWATYYFPEIEDSGQYKIPVHWSTYQEDSLWKFVIRTYSQSPDEEIVIMSDFWIYF